MSSRILRNTVFLALVVALSISMVSANGSHDTSEAKNLIEQKIPCSELSDAQLATIGDYYMEQIHPESHEQMDQMMGGHGSQSLQDMHINLAERFYCGQGTGQHSDSGMMGPGMMQGGNYGSMMSPFYGGFFGILAFIALLGLVILIYLKIYQNWNEIRED